MEQQGNPRDVSMTDLVINAITQAHMGDASEKDKDVFVTTLRELVRLAKTEKILEMKYDTMTALGVKDEAKVIIEQAMLKAVRSLHSLSGEKGNTDAQ